MPVNNKLTLEFFINGIESSEGSGIDRLKAWPENVACDFNFRTNEPPPLARNIIYYAGGTLQYLLNKNILANLNINFRDNEVLWDLSISYSYK